MGASNDKTIGGEPILAELYFADPRTHLIPIEHLSPEGVTPAYGRELARRLPYAAAALDLLNTAFPLYWQRSAELAGRTNTWATPRLRNLAIVDSSAAIPPYVQLLNTSTWTLFDVDFQLETSSPEFLAYLLVHGDRMSLTGDATNAALLNAAYWFDRSAAEIADFEAGARTSTRPDGEAFTLLADALPWMRRIRHETLRPPASGATGYRPITGSGLLVPREIEGNPLQLLSAWKGVAEGALARYYERYRQPSAPALTEILEWLRDSSPRLVITGRKNRVLWDHEHADRIGSLRGELRNSGEEVLHSIRADLEVLDHNSRTFLSRCASPAELQPNEDIGQDGYTYLYRGRPLLAYNLHETHLERLRVPSLPFARLMLGARAYHEWCHLAVDAGWVRTRTSAAPLVRNAINAIDNALDAAPSRAIALCRASLDDLRRRHSETLIDWGGETIDVDGSSYGAALVRMLLPRVADFKANLLAATMQSLGEREAYVRQNIRSLRWEYRREELWQMLARYVYELQYMRFSDIADTHRCFLTSTWFESDYLSTEILSRATFEHLDETFACLLDVFEIDTDKIDTAA